MTSDVTGSSICSRGVHCTRLPARTPISPGRRTGAPIRPIRHSPRAPPCTGVSPRPHPRVICWPVSSIAPITSPPRRPGRAAPLPPGPLPRTGGPRSSLPACPRTHGSATAASGLACSPGMLGDRPPPSTLRRTLADHAKTRSAQPVPGPPSPYPGSSRLRFICPHKTHDRQPAALTSHESPHPARSTAIGGRHILQSRFAVRGRAPLGVMLCAPDVVTLRHRLPRGCYPVPVIARSRAL